MKWIKEQIKQNNKITLEDIIAKYSLTYPLLLEFKNTPQDSEWHAEGDVHIHTNMVISETYKLFIENDFTDQDKYILLMAAIFHDVAKPLTTKEKEINNITRIISPQHEKDGMSYLFYRFLEEDMTKHELYTILDLVGHHQKPKMLVIKNKSEWHYKSLMQYTPGYLFYFHQIADMKGRTAHDINKSLDILEEFKMFCQEYNCFKTTSTIKKDINSILTENFNVLSSKALTYITNKTYQDLISDEYSTPLVGFSKYYDHKDEHPHVYILCGISGSGKSTTVKTLTTTQNITTIISLDMLRQEHKLNNTNRRKVEGRVLQEAKKLFKTALANKENIIWDACSLRKDFRQIIIDLANQYNGQTTLVFVTNTITQCVINDQKREKPIGKEIILKQVNQFQFPDFESFDNIMII